MTTHKAKLRKFEFIGSGSAPEGDEARGDLPVRLNSM
jgi:hypothetical protein